MHQILIEIHDTLKHINEEYCTTAKKQIQLSIPIIKLEFYIPSQYAWYLREIITDYAVCANAMHATCRW